MVFSFSVASGRAYLTLSLRIKFYFLGFPYHISTKTYGLIKLVVLILLHSCHDFANDSFWQLPAFLDVIISAC